MTFVELELRVISEHIYHICYNQMSGLQQAKFLATRSVGTVALHYPVSVYVSFYLSISSDFLNSK